VVVLVVAADAVGKTAKARPSPPQTVKSADGGLTVAVPRGALRKPAKVRIRVLTPGQYPPELKGATFKPGSKLYSLEPSGLRFLKPVTLTRRIDAKLQGFDLTSAVPGVVLTTRGARGAWEILKGQTVTPVGQTLVLTAKTSHFSTVVAFDGGARLSLDPPSVEKVVGETFAVGLKLDVDNLHRSNPIDVDEDEGHVWSSAGSITGPSGRLYGSVHPNTYTCARVGTGRYRLLVTLEESNLAVSIATLRARGYTQDFHLTGTATCSAAPPTTLELALACVAVTHSPFGPFPSFMNWLFQFTRSTLPPNPRAELTATGVNNGQAVSAAIDPATGKADVKAGISSFGPKQIQRLTVNGRDVTQQLVAKVGAAPTVTSSQGVVAGRCPP
jgi:hypothetical protein